jgi:hypothetical protein
MRPPSYDHGRGGFTRPPRPFIRKGKGKNDAMRCALRLLAIWLPILGAFCALEWQINRQLHDLVASTIIVMTIAIVTLTLAAPLLQIPARHR